ncbi:MAG: response regulator [Endomicrobiales bacterium]|nr:response regulator [Endomicrobiales bacterium]
MIKVLLVDDSTFMRKTIRQMLSYDPEIEIVGEAGDGRDAVDKVLNLKPDVVTMDLIMPGVDGLWALEEIMKQKPTPVIVVSSIGIKPSEIVSEAFALGVVDVITKPDNPQAIGAIQKDFVEKIRAASKINRFRLLEYKTTHVKEKTSSNVVAHQAVIIATSAGGPTSLYEVIPRFSKNFFGSVLVAQHMPFQFMNSFVEHIQKMTPLDVKIATKGDILYSKRILFSPTNSTLEVNRTKKGCVVNIVDLKTRLQPDINYVIASCAEAFRSGAILVVLSGLGNDSVKGAEMIKKYGGKVIVEDESTASVYSGMPSNVVKSGFYDVLCPSYNIAEAVESFLANKNYTTNTKRFMVKGAILKNAVQYISSKYSNARCEKILYSLSENSKKVIGDNIRQYNYYQGEIYYELYSKIEEEIEKENPHILEELGAENVRECIDIYRAVLSVTSVYDLLSFIQALQKIVFPGLSGEKFEVQENTKSVVFTLRSIGFTEENIGKIAVKVTKGWMQYLFKYIQIKLAESSCDVGKDEKGLYLKCSAKWS